MKLLARNELFRVKLLALISLKSGHSKGKMSVKDYFFLKISKVGFSAKLFKLLTSSMDLNVFSSHSFRPEKSVEI